MKDIRETITRIWGIIPIENRGKFLYWTCALTITSLLELLGIGMLLPLFSVILQEEDSMGVMRFFSSLGVTDTGLIVLMIGAIIALGFLLKNLIFRYIVKKIAKYTFGIYKSLSLKMYVSVFSLNSSNVKAVNSNYIARDIEAAPRLFSQNILIPTMQIISELFIVLLMIIGLTLYDPLIIILVTCLIFPPFVFYYKRIKDRLEYISKRRHEINGEQRRGIQEGIYGINEIRIYRKEKEFYHRFASRMKDLEAINVDFHYYNIMPPKIIETAMVFGVVALFIMTVYLYDTREQIMLTLTVFGLAAFRTLPSFNRLLASLMGFKIGIHVLPILEEFLNMEKDFISENQEDSDFDNWEGMSIKNVSHGYNDSDGFVLNEVNLTINPGELVAVIGKSGSGKSTLVNILLGLMKPSKGCVVVNETKLTSQNVSSLWKYVGYVKQDAFILDSTIGDNLNLSMNHNYSDELKMIESLRDAGFTEDELDLKTLESNVGESGGKLSGGQRQRLSIARALYKGSKLIVYDEATSSVDRLTEDNINQTILSLREKGVAQVVISHKVGILQSCDRVYELENSTIRLLTCEEINRLCTSLNI